MMDFSRPSLESPEVKNGSVGPNNPTFKLNGNNKTTIPTRSSNSKPPTSEDKFDNDSVTLVEDIFGQYRDEDGISHTIKRFTWRNKNKIEVQVINYGARVISLKLPDKKGTVEDIVLGFDDLAGYIFYEKHYFGSIVGRVSNIIKNSKFTLDKQNFTITSNLPPHSFHGGNTGFDKMIWDTFICGKSVIMSHISPHLTEGYPGDLLVRVYFELSGKNEFKISMDAQTTRPTIINLSHLLYFNLAGHHTGPDEIYRHYLTLNCNCFTHQENGVPTGEIFNVIHSQFDFQIPKLLGKVMGIVPKDGYNQNLCVNRGVYQNECFVGRLFHPPSGRMLEIYSNQPGVHIVTGNEFGYGNILSMKEIIDGPKSKEKSKSSIDRINNSMLIFQKVHEKVLSLLKVDEEQNFDEIKKLILKFRDYKQDSGSQSMEKLIEEGFKVTSMQKEYLTKAKEVVCENEETDEGCLDLKEALSKILKLITEDSEEATTSDSKTSHRSSDLKNSTKSATSSTKKSYEKIDKKESSSIKVVLEEEDYVKIHPSIPAKSNKEPQNKIPSFYTSSDQIRGKGRAVYKMHGGIALQTQNYPNSVNIKHFPNCSLKPGEIYKHDIVYRFWIRSGNPNKWIKRNLHEATQKSTNKNK